MFCEKCGEKQELNAKFCGKCGHKLNNNNDIKKSNLKDELKLKFASISKKNKIIMGSVLLITLIAIIILGVLLNNPIKKVEDSLDRYYNAREENSFKELINIGKVLKDNKNEEKVLHSIKNTVENITYKWVKNFNTEYKDLESLKKNYNKVKNALDDLYKYFNGIEYILDTKIYNDYITELKTYYYSKEAYFEALKYEQEDLYKAYYYYQKVDENDSYYKKSQKFISAYVKDEVENLKVKSAELIKIDKDSSNEEILESYLEQIKYLDTHKISNNIDLSETEEYKALLNTNLAKIIETTKNIVNNLKENANYEKIVNTINDTIMKLQDIVNEEDLKELTKLKEIYQDKLPLSLLQKERLSYYGVEPSNYKKTINGKEYNNNLSFSINAEKSIIVYNLNKEYKTLKTTLVKENNEISNSELTIYGDNLEIYKMTIDEKCENEIDIEINVENIKELKIELNNKTVLSKDYLYLVEPYLYK